MSPLFKKITVGILVTTGLLMSMSAFAIEYKAITTVPGVSEKGKNIKNPAVLVTGVYNAAIGIGAILAVIMIIIGGMRYTVSEAMTTKTEAREQIQDALIGLVLLLGSFLILKTINVDLINLKLALPTEGNNLKGLQSGWDAATEALSRARKGLQADSAESSESKSDFDKAKAELANWEKMMEDKKCGTTQAVDVVLCNDLSKVLQEKKDEAEQLGWIYTDRQTNFLLNQSKALAGVSVEERFINLVQNNLSGGGELGVGTPKTLFTQFANKELGGRIQSIENNIKEIQELPKIKDEEIATVVTANSIKEAQDLVDIMKTSQVFYKNVSSINSTNSLNNFKQDDDEKLGQIARDLNNIHTLMKSDIDSSNYTNKEAMKQKLQKDYNNAVRVFSLYAKGPASGNPCSEEQNKGNIFCK